MSTKHVYILIGWFFLWGCQEPEKSENIRKEKPVISADGERITFPDTAGLSSFRTDTVLKSKTSGEWTAPGRVTVNIIPSAEGAEQNIVLFEDTELSAHYADLIRLQNDIRQIQEVRIPQRETELDRVKDLHGHGSATGQELLAAETELSEAKAELIGEKTGLIEHETMLTLAGFPMEVLRKTPAGTAFLISSVPEDKLHLITVGTACKISFSAFPDRAFTGTIHGITDQVDPVSRMANIRVRLDNPGRRFKSGMFANISFPLSGAPALHIKQKAVVTVRGQDYVFLKISEDTFERRKILSGPGIGDRITVYEGVEENDEVVTQGTLQLKGLSFGY